MDVQIKMDLVGIDRRVVEAAKTCEAKEVYDQLHALFRPNAYGQAEGVGRTQIREKVEEIIERHWDEGKFIADLERMVPALMQKYVEEALHEAAKHKARKLAFNVLNDMWKADK